MKQLGTLSGGCALIYHMLYAYSCESGLDRFALDENKPIWDRIVSSVGAIFPGEDTDTLEDIFFQSLYVIADEGFLALDLSLDGSVIVEFHESIYGQRLAS